MMETRVWVLSFVLATWGGLAVAGPSSSVVWTVETINMLKSADAAKGQQLAQTCAGCHGAEGVSPSPMNPHLAGQDAAYTYKQLVDYKEGTRANPIMMGMVGGLSDQDMADLAVFYAAQPLPGGSGSTEEVPVLVRKGDGPRLIPACDTCHGDNGQGNARSYGMPALAAQTADYLKQTLADYKSGARANDVYSVMRAIAQELSEDEQAALATYYSGL